MSPFAHILVIFVSHLLTLSCSRESFSKELLQAPQNISVTTERELQEAFLSLVEGQTIQLDSEEFVLTEALTVNVSGVTIVGGRNSTTRIRCSATNWGNALVVKEGITRIHSIEFTQCKRDSAVRVDVRSGSRSETLRVSFDHVIFSENGNKRGFINGGAVRVESCFAKSCMRPAVAFRVCRFSKNHGMYGGAISAEDARLRIEGSMFVSNEADLSGGAIHVHNQKGAIVKVVDTLFEDNVAHADARVHLANDTELLQTENQKLATVGMGGAIFAHSPNKLKILRSSFARNKGCRGGGAIRLSHENLSAVQNATFVFNVSDSKFESNEAFCGSLDDVFINSRMRAVRLGGAISYEALADVKVNWTLQGSDFGQNIAWSGGGVSVQSVALSTAQHHFVSCTFDENNAVMAGGGLIANAAQIVLTSTLIRRSRALAGAGITLWTDSSLFTRTNPLNATSSTIIEGCESIYGAGISADLTSVIDLAALIIRNNLAYRYGGAIRAFSIQHSVVLRGVLIENNKALVGGAIAATGLAHFQMTSDRGVDSVIRNNTACVGGGIHFEPGQTAYFNTDIRGARFIQNKALNIDSAEIQKLDKSEKTFRPVEKVRIDIPNHVEQLADENLLSFLTSIPAGHGGGIAMTLVDIRLFTVANLMFQNVYISENEAVVGGKLKQQGGSVMRVFRLGGMSIHMSNVQWNRRDNSACAPSAFGLGVCQRFVLVNATITKNKADYAGGLFSTLPDGISVACSPNNETFTTITGAMVEEKETHESNFALKNCINVTGNEISDGAEILGKDGGTRAAALTIEGWSGHLKEVASGESLALPCEDDPGNKTCSQEIRVLVKDIFNQTIVRGISDANLTLTLISDAISGTLRYTAVNGTAIINATDARGIARSSTLRIVSEHDPDVYIELELSTRKCYLGESAQVDVCIPCPKDQYGFVPALERCEVCEENAVCSGGAALVPAEGYWHSTPFSPVFHRCIHPDACKFEGREENLTAFYEEREQLELAVKETFHLQHPDDKPSLSFPEYQQCKEGYEDILCGACQAGYGHSLTGACEECPSERLTKWFYIFLTAAWLFLVFGANCLVTLSSMNSRVQLVKYEQRSKSSNKPPALGRMNAFKDLHRTSLRGDRARMCSDQSASTDIQSQLDYNTRQFVATVQLTESLKILINYLQVTSSALHLQTDWHVLLNGLLEAEAGLVGLSAEIWSVPFECNFDDSGTRASISALWIRLATPWVVVLALMFVFSIIWAALKSFRDSSRNSDSEPRFTRTRFITCLIVISIVSIYFSYIGIVRALLRSINCVEIGQARDGVPDDHPYLKFAEEPARHEYWAEDTALTCYEGQHLPAAIVGYVGLFFGLCGILLIVIWPAMNKQKATKEEFVARYWFLYQAYKSDWYTVGWESTILTRKALIAAVLVFSRHLGSSLQASMCVGILFVCHILHSVFSPFKSPVEHEYLPEYAGDILKSLHLPKLAKGWIQLNNSIHLNSLESASLAGSTIVFYCAIILHDPNSTLLGRRVMIVFTFVVNLLFLMYMLFRLYCGLHVLVDLKLEARNTPFVVMHANSMGFVNLMVKAFHTIIDTQENIHQSPQNALDEETCEEPPLPNVPTAVVEITAGGPSSEIVADIP